MTTNHLEVTDLEAGYGNFLVLKGVDLTIEDEQIVCLIGPNGAGKSTVFRCIYGLLEPGAGDITYGGESIVGLDQRALLNRGIAYVLQRDAVFSEMTIRENLELGAFTVRDSDTVEARIEEMFEMFPLLEERAASDAGTLSGGERQMLEFARGLMTDPEILLLDEPSAGLAPKIIDQVFEKIVDINELGVTILMIEQNIKTGLDYSNYAYVLENGTIRFDGRADTILDDPEIRDAYLGEGSQPDS
jgi:ABC-type branched-subunit amino acid transport system ATPase component